METTFRSRFRFRFLKYPLSKKSRFFSGTRNNSMVQARTKVRTSRYVLGQNSIDMLTLDLNLPTYLLALHVHGPRFTTQT